MQYTHITISKSKHCYLACCWCSLVRIL